MMKPEPVRIFSDDPHLNCEFCGKNLLEGSNLGNYIVFKSSDDNYAAIRYACKEHDSNVTDNANQEDLKDDGWDDVDDMLLPTIWIKKLMAFMNELYTSRDKVSAQYFDDVKKLFLNTFPYIARDMSKEEIDRVRKIFSFEF